MPELQKLDIATCHIVRDFHASRGGGRGSTKVLGGPERMRVVLSSVQQQQRPSCLGVRRFARCVEQQQQHASVDCDSGPRAWGPGERARCVFVKSSLYINNRQPNGSLSNVLRKPAGGDGSGRR